MEFNFEQLLQRSNRIKNRISSDIKPLSGEILNWKESPKKWSVLEVIGHLNQVYAIYLDNFQKAIDAAPQLKNGEFNHKQSTLLGKLSIYTMRPREKKVKYKMKTFKFFEPDNDANQTDETIRLFLENKDRFNDLIKEARLKNLKGIKMPTALGDKMKFYVPECFDFILAHEERHMVQLDNVLNSINEIVPTNA